MVLQCCGGGDLSFGGDCGEYVGAEVAIFNLVGAQLGLRSPRSGVFYSMGTVLGLGWRFKVLAEGYAGPEVAIPSLGGGILGNTLALRSRF